MYSNKSRGLRKKQGILKPRESLEQEPVNIEIIDVSDYQPPGIPSKKWREYTCLSPQCLSGERFKKLIRSVVRNAVERFTS
ncbi:MAG: hypothetical protein MRK02_02095 [Candidatus Scalindua sp.]|nr:hypothetical protein [Candidatus Scalindua sp.]